MPQAEPEGFCVGDRETDDGQGKGQDVRLLRFTVIATFGAAVFHAAPAAPAGCSQLAGNVVQTGTSFLAEFLPFCTVVDSGDSVAWSAELGSGAHNPQSFLDNGACFRASDFSGLVRPGRAFHLSLFYDGASLLVSTQAGLQECSDVLDPSSTVDEAVLPYVCNIHQQGRGTIVVRRAG